MASLHAPPSARDRTAILNASDAAKELPQVGVNSVPLKLVIGKLVRQSYVDLARLSQVLHDHGQRQPDGPNGKELLLQYIYHTRQQFLKVIIALRWLKRTADNVQTCHRVIGYLKGQNDHFQQAVGALHNVFVTMGQAKVRNYDVLTAVDVLSAGTYLRLPTIIRDHHVPPTALASTEVTRVLAELGDAIRLRLLFQETLPPPMRQYRIAQGRVIFHIPGEFEVALTLYTPDAQTPFHVVKLRVLTRSDSTAFPLLPAMLGRIERHHLMQLAQQQLLPQVPPPATPDDATPTTDFISPPLVRLYDTLHMFALSYQLGTLYTQAAHLAHSRWNSLISVERDAAGTMLQLRYWDKALLHRQTVQLKSAHRLPSLMALPCPSAVESVDAVQALSVRENLIHLSIVAGSSLPTPVTLRGLESMPSDDTFLQVEWCGNSGLELPNYGKWDRLSSDPHPLPLVDPTRLNMENVLVHLLTVHAGLILRQVQTTLLQQTGFDAQLVTTPLPPIENSQRAEALPLLSHVLRIGLAPFQFIGITVDIRTGQLMVHDATHAVKAGPSTSNGLELPSTVLAATCDAPTRINPAHLCTFARQINESLWRIDQCLDELQAQLLFDRAEHAAVHIGLTVDRRLNVSQLQLNRLLTPSALLAVSEGTGVSEPVATSTPSLRRYAFLALPGLTQFYLVFAVVTMAAPTTGKPAHVLRVYLTRIDPLGTGNTIISSTPMGTGLPSADVQLSEVIPLKTTLWASECQSQSLAESSARIFSTMASRPLLTPASCGYTELYHCLAPQQLRSLVYLCAVKVILVSLEKQLQDHGLAFTYQDSTLAELNDGPRAGPAAGVGSVDVPRLTIALDLLLAPLRHLSAMCRLLTQLLGPIVHVFILAADASLATGALNTDIPNGPVNANFRVRFIFPITAPRLQRLLAQAPVPSAHAASKVTVCYHTQRQALVFETEHPQQPRCVATLAACWEQALVLTGLLYQVDQAASHQPAGLIPPNPIQAFDFEHLTVKYASDLVCTFMYHTTEPRGDESNASPKSRLDPQPIHVTFSTSTTGTSTSDSASLSSSAPRSETINPHRHLQCFLQTMLNVQCDMTTFMATLHGTLELLLTLDHLQARGLAECFANGSLASLAQASRLPLVSAHHSARPSRLIIVPQSARQVCLVGWHGHTFSFRVLSRHWVQLTHHTQLDGLLATPQVNGTNHAPNTAAQPPMLSRPIPSTHLPPPSLAAASTSNDANPMGGESLSFSKFQQILFQQGPVSGASPLVLPGTMPADAPKPMMVQFDGGILYTTGLTWYVLGRFFEFGQASLEVQDVHDVLRQHAGLSQLAYDPAHTQFRVQLSSGWLIQVGRAAEKSTPAAKPNESSQAAASAGAMPSPARRWELQVASPNAERAGLTARELSALSMYATHQTLWPMTRFANGLQSLTSLLTLSPAVLKDCVAIMILALSRPLDNSLQVIWHWLSPRRDGGGGVVANGTGPELSYLPLPGEPAVVVRDGYLGLILEFRDTSTERSTLIPLWHNCSTGSTEVWEKDSAGPKDEMRDRNMPTKYWLDLARKKNQNMSRPARLLSEKQSQCPHPSKLFWSVQQLAQQSLADITM
ncbi:mediator complex subunit [Dimargaris xerosporica]|nr:mediator complex subunit [Dimargaris xerosporica]